MKVTPPLQPRWGLPLAALSLLLLSACGGGSDGGLVQNQNTINSGGEVSGQGLLGDNCTTQPGSPGVCANPVDNGNPDGGNTSGITINRDNAASIVNSMLGIIATVYDFGERSGIASRIITASKTKETGQTSPFSLLRFIRGQLNYMSALDSQFLLDTPHVVGIHSNPIIPCENPEGSVTAEKNGNTTIATFGNCVYQGIIIDGGVTITLATLSGAINDPSGAWELDATFSFNGFSISDGNDTIAYSGSISFTANGDAGTGNGQIAVTDPLGIAIGNQTDTLLRGFDISYSFDTNATTLNISGDLRRSISDSSRLTISTQQELTLNETAGTRDTVGQLLGPYRNGQLSVSSGDNSFATLNIISNSAVEILVNGIETLEMSWETLLAS